MRPDTILFDVDGTLLDTSEFIFAAYERTGRELGFAIPDRDRLAQRIGEPIAQIYESLAPAGLGSRAVTFHRAFQRDNLALVRVFAGVPEMLDALLGLGLTLGAVTSRSVATARPSLESACIDHLLGAVVGAEDVPDLKPHPAPLLLALDRLGRHPQSGWMVGDTHHDVEAGKALDMYTVAALYGFHGERVLSAEPDDCIHTPGELLSLVIANWR